MKRTVRPSSAALSMRPRHFSWNAMSPTERTSSMIRISGSRWAATEKASRICMPLE